MKSNGKTKEKVIRLDERVDTILTNHLPHIYEELKGLNQKYDKLSDKIEDVKDEFKIFVAKIGATIAIIILIAQLVITYFHK